MKVAVFGLGVIGLSLTCVLGYKGYSVIGIDSDRNKVSKICKGDPTFYEPKLENMLKLALKKSLEIGIDRREFYRLKKKLESDRPIVLRKKILEKLLKKNIFAS